MPESGPRAAARRGGRVRGREESAERSRGAGQVLPQTMTKRRFEIGQKANDLRLGFSGQSRRRGGGRRRRRAQRRFLTESYLALLDGIEKANEQRIALGCVRVDRRFDVARRRLRGGGRGFLHHRRRHHRRHQIFQLTIVSDEAIDAIDLSAGAVVTDKSIILFSRDVIMVERRRGGTNECRSSTE